MRLLGFGNRTLSVLIIQRGRDRDAFCRVILPLPPLPPLPPFIRQNVSINHVNVPIDQISWHKIKILFRNRTIFGRLDFNMRFNIDIQVILKKWRVELMCMWHFCAYWISNIKVMNFMVNFCEKWGFARATTDIFSSYYWELYFFLEF